MEDNRSAALATSSERKEMLDKIFASERTLNTFIERMANNQKFRAEKPNTHKFFSSLNHYRSVRGRLTDNQKVAINREIIKYSDYFMTLRIARSA